MEFTAALENLEAAVRDQAAIKLEKPVKTQEYYAALNTAWRYMKEINIASKVVFAGNYEMLNAFELYPEAKGRRKKKKEMGEGAEEKKT